MNAYQDPDRPHDQKHDHEEIEVKFFLNDPIGFESKLMAAGALLTGPRTHEQDLRFDDDRSSLQSSNRVLRLRKDQQVSLTYKGEGKINSGVSSRLEVEVRVSDFSKMRKFLEALGYRLVMQYEKYRTTFILDQCEIVLDEMPYGWFCEIEAESPEAIRDVAGRLGLNWKGRINDSYVTLFRRCKDNLGLNFDDLTFINFKGITVKPKDLGVKTADL